jgi:hypothetical protein
MDWKLSIFYFPEMDPRIRTGMCLINVDIRDLREIMIEHRPREDAASEKAGEVCVNPKGERDGMV